MNGGILPKPAQVPAPNHWAVYFAVEDLDKTIERAKALGGRAEMDVIEIPPGRFTVMFDPAGGAFTAFQLNPATPT